MSRISARKVVAFAVSSMLRFALGFVTGPVVIILFLFDQVHASVWIDWMNLQAERVYSSIAHEHVSRL